MATKRSILNALAKTFDQTPSLIYLLGPKRKIRYVNAACAQWLECDADELMGGQCQYRSEPTGDLPADRLAGLCPPPEFFASNQYSLSAPFNISRPHPTNPDNTHWRQATGFKLAQAIDGVVGDAAEPNVLVVSLAVDCKQPPTNAGSNLPEADSESQQLHDSLTQIYRQSGLATQAKALVGNSPFAKRLRRQSQMASEVRSDVLIAGPAGGGKEHLARVIHTLRGGSSPSLLIPIDCVVADQELIRNAIGQTLAQQKRNRHSEHQTPTPWLLLLNVDRLPALAQSELLQFLRQPDFPLRSISTASRSLFECAAAGEFETALAHLLSTLTIELVPLQERLEDLPLLAQSILEQQNLQREQQLSRFEAGAMQMLLEFDWPGNIDQLAEVIEAAAKTATSESIISADFPPKFNQLLKAQRIGGHVVTEIKLDDYLQSIEKELVARALQQAQGNKTKTASLLGISRAKLLRRLQHFDIGTDPEIEFEEIE